MIFNWKKISSFAFFAQNFNDPVEESDQLILFSMPKKFFFVRIVEFIIETM